MAWLLSTVQNGGNNVKFWASFETNFIRETCTLEAETCRVAKHNICEVFTSIDKKYTFLG